MRQRERGFSQLHAVGAIVAGLALAAFAVWYHGWLDEQRAEAKRQGIAEERGRWQDRENAELARANAAIAFLNEKYRGLEAAHAKAVNAAAAKYHDDLKGVQRERDKALSDARAGMAFRLRWAATCAPAPGQGAGGSAGAAPGAAPAGAVQTATCELPEATRNDLIRLASDADAAVGERNALLAIAIADREACR